MTDRETERIAVLETKISHIERNFDDLREQNTKIAHDVKEMHDLLMQAKGAKWVIIGMASLAGFVAAKLGSLTAMFGVKMP
jgi:predicted esterase YcpF (UPF0227 family)